jgi:hypothetical protein
MNSFRKIIMFGSLLVSCCIFGATMPSLALNSRFPANTSAIKVAAKPESLESFNHKKFVRSILGDFLNRVPDLASRTEYFYTEVDLNNDGSREIVLGIFGLICGASECNGYILQKSGLVYKMIGKFGVQSTGGETVALQQTKSNGFMDIATQLYNRTTHKSVWRVYQFDGNAYVNTYQDLSSHPNRVILNVTRGSGLKL